MGRHVPCGVKSLMTEGKAIAARIRGLAKSAGRPVSVVLNDAGLGPSFVKDLDQGRIASPRAQTLQKIASALAVPVELLLGVATTPVRDPGVTAAFDVPEYDVQVSAGGGALIEREAVKRKWRLPLSYLEAIGVDPAQSAFVTITGDSMSPTLLHGDLVLLDLRSRNPALPAIYALWDGDATVCKRLEKVHGSQPLRVRIISENQVYTAYEVPAETVQIIGRVAWFARRM